MISCIMVMIGTVCVHGLPEKHFAGQSAPQP